MENEKNERDVEILKWHYAGKPHFWIATKYGVTKEYISELIFENAKKMKVG